MASRPGSGWKAAWPVARAAGWSRTELWWEELQERANEALAAGDRRAAIRGFRLAWALAALSFRRDDPRYAASLANRAAAARLSGAEARARRHYAKAARLWQAVPSLVETAEIAPRARSSLFHLRMEALHRETFEANRRRRLGAFVAEAGDTLAALCAGTPPPNRHFARWRGEKPAIFDGGRRILAAALLIATPQEAAERPDGAERSRTARP